MIHTRVPESLEAELRERAQTLGMSVSNLVRNVLGHAFGLVGDVVADSHAIARAAKGEVKSEDVIGWQPLVLNKNAVCALCNELLPKGSDAALGIAESGGGRSIICTSCLEQQR